MSYDLTLEAPRGTLLPLAEMQKFVEALQQETKIEYLSELVPHFGGIRPRGDARDLAEYFDDGVFQRAEYEEFCAFHNLAPDRSETEADSAARLFKDYKWGQPIVTAYTNGGIETLREAYQLLVDFARRNNLVLQDPQIPQYVDLDNPGDLPPMYSQVGQFAKPIITLRAALAFVIIIATLIGLALPYLHPKK